MFLTFSVSSFIPSENYLYQPKMNWATKRPFLYLNPDIREYKDRIAEVVLIKLKNEREALPAPINIISTFCFGISKTRYFECDLSNMVKSTEDAIISGIRQYEEFIGIKEPKMDDKYIVASAKIKLLTNTKEEEGFRCDLFINSEETIEDGILPTETLVSMLQEINSKIEYMRYNSLPFSFLLES